MQNDILLAILTILLLSVAFLTAYLCDCIRIRRFRQLTGHSALREPDNRYRSSTEVSRETPQDIEA